MTPDTGERAGPRRTHKSLTQLSARPLGGNMGVVRGPSRTGIKRREPKAEQREKALATANAIRLARSNWKSRMRNGKEDIRATIDEPPPYLHSASVSEVLTAVHRVGHQTVRKVCGRAHVNQLSHLGKLTDQQKERLLWAMQDVARFGGTG